MTLSALAQGSVLSSRRAAAGCRGGAGPPLAERPARQCTPAWLSLSLLAGRRLCRAGCGTCLRHTNRIPAPSSLALLTRRGDPMDWDQLALQWPRRSWARGGSLLPPVDSSSVGDSGPTLFDSSRGTLVPRRPHDLGRRRRLHRHPLDRPRGGRQLINLDVLTST